MYRILWQGAVAMFIAAPVWSGGTPHERPTHPATGIAPPTRIPQNVTAGPAVAGEPVSITAVPRETRRAVVADAARRFSVAESAVVLTRAEQVSWPDAALGCPEPERSYSQAVVPGFRVVAKTPGGELVYHTDEGVRAVSCTTGARKPPREELRGRPAVEPVKGEPARPAGR